jgi:hypothetical protein
VGKEDKDNGGARFPKTYSSQKFIYPVVMADGSPGYQAVERDDRPPGASKDSIDSGGSVPSCGQCQALLPALICEMKPCG